MSGIFGVFHTDGRPADPALLARMSEALSHRGPDRRETRIDGPVGLGSCALHTTPEAVRERLPLENEAGTLILTLDGRIDNRRDLIRELQGRGAVLRDDTDAELVLKAYEAWGTESVRRLIGDFAFAIWDVPNRRLLCARDFMGLKPLYYAFDGKTFRFASELAAILADPDVPRRPNEGMIGEYLSVRISSKEETFFDGIFRLLPAHVLDVRAGRMERRRYWEIDPERRIRHRTDKEYGEHFREIFREAVRSRLRGTGPVVALLSGGLDSSSIVCTALDLAKDAGVPPVETMSMVFPGEPCDESAYIDEVLRERAPRSTLLRPRTPELSLCVEQVRRYLEHPDYPNGGASDPTPGELRRRGLRVLLSGLGGDEWLTGSYCHYADLMREGRLAELLQQYRADLRLERLETIGLQRLPLLRSGVWLLLPEAVRNLLRRTRRPPPPMPWVQDEFARRIDLSRRSGYTPSPVSFRSRADEHIYRAATGGRGLHALEINERCAAAHGFEYRFPFHDRRLVDFALAIPERQRWRGTETKFVLRTAMRGILPERIRQRKTKASFGGLFSRVLTSPWAAELLNNLDIARLGWVRQETVSSMQAHFAAGGVSKSQGLDLWGLWVVLGAELWYKTAILGRVPQP